MSDDAKPGILPPDGLGEWLPRDPLTREKFFGVLRDGPVNYIPDPLPPPGLIIDRDGHYDAGMGCRVELDGNEVIIRGEDFDLVARDDGDFGMCLTVPNCPCRRVDCTC